jgi:hypothetical protein
MRTKNHSRKSTSKQQDFCLAVKEFERVLAAYRRITARKHDTSEARDAAHRLTAAFTQLSKYRQLSPQEAIQRKICGLLHRLEKLKARARRLQVKDTLPKAAEWLLDE